MNDEGFGKKDLRAAEREAVGLKAEENSDSLDADNISGARKEEESARGFYSGRGLSSRANSRGFAGFSRRGTNETRGTSKKGGKRDFKGMMKKRGPVAAIGGILIAVVGLMNGAQSLMPVAIEEMIIEKFNSIGISSTMASDNFLNTQLNQGVLTHSEKRGEVVNGVQTNLFAFSEYQVQQFAAQGIQVISNIDYNGIGVTVLLYKSGGKYKAVVGSDYLGKILDSAIISAAGISADDFAGQVAVKDAFNDSAFKTPYTTASKGWRGGSSGWFDQIMSNITEAKLSIDRNRWSRYIAKSIKSVTDEFKKVASSVAKNTSTSATSAIRSDEVKVGDGDNDYETQITSGDPGTSFTDENGTTHTVSNGELSGNSTLSEINSVLNSKAVKAASAAADGLCAILEGVMSIYTVVSAYQNLQFLNLISGYLEAVDKMKAGDGNASPVHEYGINLTTAASTTTTGTDGNTYVVEGRESKTAMDSSGMSWLFGKNNSISKNDPSVQNVNFESIMSNLSFLTSDIKNTAAVYEACGYVKAATAAVSLASTIVSFIPIIGQGIKAIEITAKGVAKAAIKVIAITAFHIFIPIAAKKVANLLIKDAATEWFGEDLGNALVSGANKYLGGNGSSGGQGPGDKNKVLSYLNAQDTVIAEEAKYQRSVRSPFDITSHYTFLGSLAYSIIPFAYSSGGIMSRLADISSTVSNSVIAMLPTASAIDNQSALTSNGECALLDSVDMVGDAFCNIYVITDVSTMGIAAEDVVEIVHNMNTGDSTIASLGNKVKGLDNNNFKDDGSINPKSELGYYASFCGQRVSPYGLKDAAIVDRITNKDSTASKIIDFVPGLNDAKSIYEGLKEEANIAWATGEACNASDANNYWDHNKYYARYEENERLLESIDPGYTSPVTKLAMEYYEENPLDQSFEGVIARFSGMTKEKVNDTLALIDYYEFLEEYEPEERYAFVAKPESKTILFDNENKLAENIYIVLLNTISFADVRNRSFAV